MSPSCVTGAVASQNVADMDGFSTLQAIFASSFNIGSVTVRITVVWWILFVHHRVVGADPDPDRQLDLRGRRQRGAAPGRSACR